MADLRDLLRDIQAQHAAVPPEEWRAQQVRFQVIGEAALEAARTAAEEMYPYPETRLPDDKESIQ